MAPERILEVLTTGAMRTNAANVSDQDKQLIAEWLSGRKLDTDSVGAAEKMPNQCATHPPVSDLTAPAWNGASHRSCNLARSWNTTKSIFPREPSMSWWDRIFSAMSPLR